ncbi:SRPBCC family protein [Kitasatospora nipponensis]|uniref:SRPBCC family protein n=1 Tax=Kitasatospora nipponensis TaxID=258049 RepID=A0ABP4HCW5_9ACTN
MESWEAASMASESKHISERINRTATEVYAYASDPTNLPHWASGLGSSVEQVDGRWFAQSPLGRVGIDFAPHNDYGVLDHDVTLPGGAVVHNPMRVLADGPGSEVVFTLRRMPGMSDEDYARDAATVAADLAALKALLEG